mgnify:FL=1
MASQTQITLFSIDILKKILLWKIHRARGTVVTVSPRDIRKILNIEDHALETWFGKLLSQLAREGKLVLVRFRRPRAYLVTSRLLEDLFNLDYDSLRDKPRFMLTWLEIFYLTLKLYEASWNAN